MIVDLFQPDQRGLASSVYAIGPLFGPVVGPICGGFIGQRIGWRVRSPHDFSSLLSKFVLITRQVGVLDTFDSCVSRHDRN